MYDGYLFDLWNRGITDPQPEHFSEAEPWTFTTNGGKCTQPYIIQYMDVSNNRGTPNSAILIGFSLINHLFWGNPILGNTHILEVSPAHEQWSSWRCSSGALHKNVTDYYFTGIVGGGYPQSIYMHQVLHIFFKKTSPTLRPKHREAIIRTENESTISKDLTMDL